MDAKQGPFSLYDFLGYFFPGAIAIFAGAFYLDVLGFSGQPLNWLAISKLSEFLPFVLAAYVLGHVLALLSSFSIERYFIWHFDYPSKSLLRLPPSPFLSEAFSVANVVKLVVWLLLLPVSATIAIMCAFSIGRPGMVSQLDPLLARIIRRKVRGLVVEKGQIEQPDEYAGPEDADYFRLAYHYALENAPSHVGKMQNYVALFGFNRALSLLFVLLFWASCLSLIVDYSSHAFQCGLCAALLANLFFFGFAKFYRRFSLEALMALAVTYEVSQTLLLTARNKPGAMKSVGIDIKSNGVPIVNLMRDLKRRIRVRRVRSAV